MPRGVDFLQDNAKPDPVPSIFGPLGQEFWLEWIPEKRRRLQSAASAGQPAKQPAREWSGKRGGRNTNTSIPIRICCPQYRKSSLVNGWGKAT